CAVRVCLARGHQPLGLDGEECPAWCCRELSDVVRGRRDGGSRCFRSSSRWPRDGSWHTTVARIVTAQAGSRSAPTTTRRCKVEPNRSPCRSPDLPCRIHLSAPRRCN